MCMSAKPMPFSMMPRTIRRKWVSGSISPIACAQSRHAAEGEHEAGQEDRRQEEEERHLHRLQLVPRDGGDGVADGEVGGDEEQREREQEPTLPTIGTSKRSRRRDEDDGHLHEAEAR